jgi:hypothetical protein
MMVRLAGPAAPVRRPRDITGTELFVDGGFAQV